MEEVRKFYKFWDGFKTWREFAEGDVNNLDEAQDRNHKRHMEKENRSARKKLDKEEMRRLNGMVDLSYKLDPRIKAVLEAEKLAKEASKK